MELDRILRRSRRFYRDHDLADWADAIPVQPFWSAEREQILTAAERSGMTLGFAFPPLSIQLADFDRLVEQTARKAAPGVFDNHQYREPFLADTWTKTANGKVLQRTDDLGVRTEGPYVLLFAATPNSQVWGRSGKQILEFFQAKGWVGFTVPEYLVLQRYLCEKQGDHRFYLESQDEAIAHWMWLLDSTIGTEMSLAWGSARGINLQATNWNNRDSRRTALPALVLAMR